MLESDRNAVLDEVIKKLKDRAVMTDNWEWSESLRCVVQIIERMKT